MPIYLPGEPYGQRSLVGYSLEGHKESDRTKVTEHAYMQSFQIIPITPSDSLRQKEADSTARKRQAHITRNQGTET